MLESEEKYKALFKAAKDAIILINVRKDEIVECNISALVMFRCKNEDIVGKYIFKFIPETQPDGSNSKEVLIKIVKEAVKGKPQFFECRHKRLDGTFFDGEVGINAFRLQNEILLMAITRMSRREKNTKELRKNSYRSLKIKILN